MWRVPELRLDSGLFRRRGAALVLTLALEGLLVLLLLFLVPPVPDRKKPATRTVFSVPPDKEKSEPDPTFKAHAKARASTAAAGKPVPQPPASAPPPLPAPLSAHGPLPFLVMTREEYRAANITNLPSRAAAPAPSGLSGAGDSVPGVGTGPGGEPLYAAEWYRRPRQVELDAYLPRRWAREGSGLIACRTVARYHVDDCKILGETPPGSGYGNAVLQAAFQFLVRPPRVGGKDLTGAWVSIRIDYSVIVK